MDWLQSTLGEHGGTVLGVLGGVVCVILLVAALDGRRGGGPPDDASRAGRGE